MSNYHRNFVPGGTYFFTVVSYCRRPFLTTDLSRRCLRAAIQAVRQDRPFEIVASVLLPDHAHMVWTLPPGDAAYPTRWRRIKEEFTERFLAAGGHELWQPNTRKKQGYRGIWQRRYWEHTVEDEDDLKRCVDYIHYNPCKHGVVRLVREWQWSSFVEHVRRGEYDEDWGRVDPCPNYHTPEWY
jgi:putative transposase